MQAICGCGNKYEAKRVSRYQRCPACAIRADRIRKQKWRSKQKIVAAPLAKAIERGARALVVVDDPLDVGGFAKGTVFSQDEWTQMLQHLTFTPGTVLKDGQGRLYRFELGGR